MKRFLDSVARIILLVVGIIGILVVSLAFIYAVTTAYKLFLSLVVTFTLVIWANNRVGEN